MIGFNQLVFRDLPGSLRFAAFKALRALRMESLREGGSKRGYITQ